MDRCQHCQAQMLDFLYDLLDEPEQLVLEAHLAECKDCRHALQLAQGQQRLLASAAVLDCSPVRFLAPARETMQPAADPIEQPDVLPIRRYKPIRWNPAWVAVAAVLLVLVGVGFYARHDYQTASATIEQQQESWKDLNTELAALQVRRADVTQHEQDNLQEIDARQERGELVVKAIGPQLLTGKGTTAFEVEARNARGVAVPARVETKLRRGNDLIPLLVQESSNGHANIRLGEQESLVPGEYELLVSAKREDGASVALPPLPVIVPPQEATTYLTTDRPLYRAGADVVHFRSLTLDRQTLRPVQKELALEYVLKLPDGRERVVAQGTDRLRRSGASPALLTGPDGKPLHGIGAGTFALEESLPSGEYSLLVRERRGQFSETRTRFLVSRLDGARLGAAPNWHRPVYLPGEAVEVLVSLVQSTGDPVRVKPVEVSLRVDGREMPGAQPLTTDTDGRLRVQTRVPPGARVASLQLKLQDGERTEQVPIAIPLHLPGAVLDFFPEGGNLVAGQQNRVYFQAQDRRGQPVALRGELLEGDRATGIVVTTTSFPGLGEASGLGSFQFTPVAGKRYRVRVDAPPITATASLPSVLDEGITLTVPEPVIEVGQPLSLHVRGSSPRTLRVTLTCRDEVLQIVTLPHGKTHLALPTQGASGVCRVGIVEEIAVLGHELPGPFLATSLVGSPHDPLGAVTLLLAGSHQHLEVIPRAERFVYCRPKERLDLQVKTTRMKADDSSIRVDLLALDESRRAVPAVAQVGIFDKASLAGADVRLERTLPTEAWLMSELPDSDSLQYADRLLLPVAASRAALDLVLGTRRIRNHPAENLIVVQNRRLPDYSALARERQAVKETAVTQRESLQVREDKLRDRLVSLQEDPATATAVARLAWYHEQGPRWQRGSILILGILALVALVVGLCRLFQEELIRAQRSLILAGGTSALLVLTVTLVLPESPVLEMAALVSEPAPIRFRNDERAKAGTTEPERLESEWVLVSPFGRKGRDENRDSAVKVNRGQSAPGIASAQMAMNSTPQPAPKALEKKETVEMHGSRALVGADASTADLKSKDRFDTLTLGRGMNRLTPNTLELATDKQYQESLRKQDAGNPAANFRRQLLEELSRQERDQDNLSPLAMQRKRFSQPLVVRTYAHNSLKDLAEGTPRPWAPVIYWHPVLILPGESTTIEVPFADAPSRYRIDVQAHTLDGRLGALRQDLMPGTPRE